MKIKNCIQQEIYSPKHGIKTKIVFSADHIVDDEILKQAAIAANLVGLRMDKELIPIDSLTPINIFFSEYGEVNLKMDDAPLGNYFRLIIIKCIKTREYEPIKILAIIAEEMCHHFWTIRDEKLVKHKVMEVINQLYPLVRIDDIFNMDTI